MRPRMVATAVVGSAALIVSLCTVPDRAHGGGGPSLGACCLPHGSCLDDYDSTSCTQVGGSYRGDSTACTSTECVSVPCGESGSPVCGGTCPAGTRCIDTEDLSVVVSVFVLPRAEEGNSPDSCACVDVRCGGAPLENGQGCCAGTPFTIGVQGCCNGEVVAVDTECFCRGIAEEQAIGAPIDLRATGCCALNGRTNKADQSTENGTVDPNFNIVQAACCQRQLTIDELGVGATSSTYTFGTGLDCCPGGPIEFEEIPEFDLPALLDLGGLCVGGCFEGECASQDCCRCTDCLDGFGQATCIAAGTQAACEGFCASLTCENQSYVPNAMCTEDGTCTATAAPAPAVSSTGLFTLLATLVAIGGVAIAVRRRRAA